MVAQVLCWVGGPSLRESPGEVALCRDHLRQLSPAIDAYVRDHGTWPDSPSVLVPGYVVSQEAIRCPVNDLPPYRIEEVDGEPAVTCRNHQMVVHYCQPILLRYVDVHITHVVRLLPDGSVSIENGTRCTRAIAVWDM